MSICVTNFVLLLTFDQQHLTLYNIFTLNVTTGEVNITHNPKLAIGIFDFYVWYCYYVYMDTVVVCVYNPLQYHLNIFFNKHWPNIVVFNWQKFSRNITFYCNENTASNFTISCQDISIISKYHVYINYFSIWNRWI